MSSLEEQLALFEKEVLSVTEDKTTSTEQNAVIGEPARPAVEAEQKSVAKPPISAAPSVVAPISRPAFTPIGPSALNNNSTKFIPSQLRTVQPIAGFMRPSQFPPPIPPAIPAPVVIQSGPTLYTNNETNSNGASSSAGLSGPTATKKKKNNKGGAEVTATTPGSASSGLKTMVLPSDVELLAAKRQAAKSHDNSYLGQVMRGEKKMKRFVRTGGGQIWEDPSLAEWDPNDFRIFCGDLGNEVSDELLAKAFRKYPSFQKAKVVRDNRTNKSKGYGFVSFKHQDDFIRACREMDGKYVGNRPIKLRKSNWKERNLEMVRKKDREKKKLGLTM